MATARIRAVTEYVEEHFDSGVTLTAAARRVGLSPSRLSHLFADETGQTFKAFVETTRMQRAAEMLQRTTFSIKQIAGMVGFENPFYFSLRFKAWSTFSPTDFRRHATQHLRK